MLNVTGRTIINVIGICLLTACHQQQTTDTIAIANHQDVIYQQARLNYYNAIAYPEIAQKVQSGDIVTRCGIDLTSEILKRLNEKDKTFSHIGIAVVENDTIFVYHAIGGEFNPDQKLKREPLWSFMHPQDNRMAGVFRFSLNEAQKKLLLIKVQSLYQQGVLFDLDFDWHTDDRMYCAEFVVKSFMHVLRDTSFFHHTFIMGKEGVGVDDVTTNRHCRQIGRWKY